MNPETQTDKEVAAAQLDVIEGELAQMRKEAPATLDGKAWNAYRERVARLNGKKAELLERLRIARNSGRVSAVNVTTQEQAKEALGK